MSGGNKQQNDGYRMPKSGMPQQNSQQLPFNMQWMNNARSGTALQMANRYRPQGTANDGQMSIMPVQAPQAPAMPPKVPMAGEPQMALPQGQGKRKGGSSPMQGQSQRKGGQDSNPLGGDDAATPFRDRMQNLGPLLGQISQIAQGLRGGAQF